MRMCAMRAGFTLIETLIALVIASVVTVLTLEMLATLSQNVVRLRAAVDDVKQSMLDERPMRRALQATLPTYSDAIDTVRGGSDTFSAATFAPTAGEGVASFRVSLERTADGVALIYQEGNSGQFVRYFDAHDGAAFSYRDAWGNEYTSWPPGDMDGMDEGYYALPPALIEVRATNDDEALLASYVLAYQRRLPLRVRDMAEMF